jgi:iron complex outermembrane receptor protein
LHSNRILTINNGVRQEGQQWGNEHAPEIDPFIADKLTVIKGVDELKYGSDAIGGVVLVDPKPLRNKPGYAAEINAGYFTNNQQYVASGVFEQQFKKYPAFTYRIQGTFKKAANTTTPGYRLNNTASEEKNFSLTTGFKKEKFSTELFYSQFASKLGIFTGSHIGNLTDLENAIAAPKPADVFLGQNTYAIKRPSQEVAHHLLKSKSFLKVGQHKFNILLSGQYNRRKEFDIVINNANKKPQMDLSIVTLAQDLNWEHPKKNNFNGTVGISAMQQDNTYGGRYFIPNYRSYTFGGYLIEKWSKQKWELQAGIRYDNKNINTTRLKFGGDTLNYDFHFSTFASSLNAIYKHNSNWQMNVNISLASRAPHVNELLSNGIHHGTATYEEGDIFLKPEQSVNIAAATSYHNTANTFSLDVNIYNNTINNFIYQQPVPDEPVLTIAGAFPKIKYRQTDAVLRGIDVAASVRIIKPLQWNTKFSLLRATNKKINDWLILMPADRFSNEFTFTFNDSHLLHGSYFSAELQNIFRQTRVPGDQYGKQDYKLPPKGYSLVNINASTTLHFNKLPLTFAIGVRNLLNTAYRDYLNSFRYFTDEMGRNINIRIKIPIIHNN